jgi:hypothetical protein
MPDAVDITALKGVIEDARKLAKQYRSLTGKPLGITGEVGEFAAADLKSLRLTGARQPGYDAVASDGHYVQIKARCILPGSKKSQHHPDRTFRGSGRPDERVRASRFCLCSALEQTR